MCGHCGCRSETGARIVDLATGGETRIGSAGAGHHHHDHHHGHGHAHGQGTVLELNRRILEKNDDLAARNRSWLAGREILAVNLMSAPGAGKTTLLERSLPALAARGPVAVIEGDQAGLRDAERVRAAGVPVVQVNTDTGCHLDAEMLAGGLAQLRPAFGSLLIVENVGNLVCPALFDLGERRRVAILSVTEGDDKPIKYPHLFRAADLLLINKLDLLAHVDFDIEQAEANARAVNPDVEILRLSARSGEGLEAWHDWLAREQASLGAEPFA